MCLKQTNEQEIWLSWIGFQKYRELLHTIALESPVPSVRADALALAQRAGLNQKECLRLALVQLENDPEQKDQLNVLAVMARLDTVDLTPSLLDRLVAIATDQRSTFEPYLHVLQIMEKAELVTPHGLALLRLSLGDRARNLGIRVLTDRNGSRSRDDQMMRYFTSTVPITVYRQALATARKLGPKAQDAIPLVQTVLNRVEAFPLGRAEVFDEVKNELQATLKAISVPRQETESPADSDTGLVPPEIPSSLQTSHSGRRALDDRSLADLDVRESS